MLQKTAVHKEKKQARNFFVLVDSPEEVMARANTTATGDVRIVSISERWKEEFTIPKMQAEAIFESFDGKVPSELTFTFPESIYPSYVKGEAQEENFACMRHTLVRQVFSTLYNIHAGICSFTAYNDEQNSGMTRFLMGDDDTCPGFISDMTLRLEVIRTHLTDSMMSFMFWEPFMKFVGAHCNKNVFCIYYRLPHFYGHPDFERMIVKILTTLGDNGTYNWVCDLVHYQDENGDTDTLEMTKLMMKYMVQSPKFAVFFLAINHQEQVPKDIHIGTLRKRKRE